MDFPGGTAEDGPSRSVAPEQPRVRQPCHFERRWAARSAPYRRRPQWRVTRAQLFRGCPSPGSCFLIWSAKVCPPGMGRTAFQISSRTPTDTGEGEAAETQRRDAGPLLWITKAPCGTSPIFIGMFQPCAPANVRNALAPVPVAQVITPVLAVPAVAAIMCDQLDERRGIELGRARVGQKRGRLGRDGG